MNSNELSVYNQHNSTHMFLCVSDKGKHKLMIIMNNNYMNIVN